MANGRYGLLAALYFLIAAGALINYGTASFSSMFTTGGFFIPWTAAPIFGIVGFFLGIGALVYAAVTVASFVWHGAVGVKQVITEHVHIGGSKKK